MKNTPEGINSRLGDTEERISDLEDRIMEIIQSEQEKEKQILKNEDSLKYSETTSSMLTALYRSQKERRERDRKSI